MDFFHGAVWFLITFWKRVEPNKRLYPVRYALNRNFHLFKMLCSFL
jgi:hypothetical protein